jgi:pectin methylesterase-like acyl-CoA thioesterase
MAENQKKAELQAALQQLRLFQESTRKELTATAAAGSSSPAASTSTATANSVVVDPGGATFATIGEAIASITDASQQKQYLLTIGPGTYSEKVVLKPWVFLQGAGQGTTIITAPATNDVFSRGTVVAASNSGVGSLTINCLGGAWGDWNTALACAGVTAFYAEDLFLNVDDGNNAGINLQTVGIDINLPNSGNSTVYLAYCGMLANAQNSESVAMNLLAYDNSYVEVTDSKMVGAGGSQSFGGASDGGASLNIFDSYISGVTFALDIPGNGTLIATNCQIEGPVSSGVQIVNDPPPAG